MALAFDTRSDAAQATIPAENDRINLLGYHYPGDGGASHYKKRDPNKPIVTIEPWQIENSGTIWELDEPEPDVRMLGAIGNGIANDTAALDDTWRYAQYISGSTGTVPRTQWPGAYSRFSVSQSLTIRIGPGRYKYSGNGWSRPQVTATQFTIIGAGVQNTQILITNPAIWFIDLGEEESFYGFSVRDIQFSGGAGAYRSRFTRALNFMRREFLNCVFDDYRVAAILESMVDGPYFAIQKCLFACNESSPAIGISLSGYCDGSQISECSFIRNRYHVKLRYGEREVGDSGDAPYLGPGSRLTIGPAVEFLASAGGPDSVADVWIVPNPLQGAASEEALRFHAVKFGNENASITKAKILCADESSTNPDQHSGSQSAGYVTNLSFVQCEFSAKDTGSRAPIVTTTRRLGGLTINSSCSFTGGMPVQFVEYAPSVVWSGLIQDRKNTIEIANLDGDTLRAWKTSNRPGALYLDPQHLAQSDPWVPAYFHGGDWDAGFVDLLQGQSISAAALSGADKLNRVLKDAAGGADVGAFNFESKTGFLRLSVDQARIRPDHLLWASVDLRKSSENPLPRIQIMIVDQVGAIIDRRTFALPNDWATFTFFAFASSVATGHQLLISPVAADFVNGSVDQLEIGRVRLHHGKGPCNVGPIFTASNLAWDRDHIVGGTRHLWIDGSGSLRLSTDGAPTSDTSGALIGPMPEVQSGTLPPNGAITPRRVGDEYLQIVSATSHIWWKAWGVASDNWTQMNT